MTEADMVKEGYTQPLIATFKTKKFNQPLYNKQMSCDLVCPFSCSRLLREFIDGVKEYCKDDESLQRTPVHMCHLSGNQVSSVKPNPKDCAFFWDPSLCFGKLGKYVEPMEKERGQEQQVRRRCHVLGGEEHHWQKEDRTVEKPDYRTTTNLLLKFEGTCRNTKRNTLQKMMEWEEQGEVKDLDLTLPGRTALGANT